MEEPRVLQSKRHPGWLRGLRSSYRRGWAQRQLRLHVRPVRRYQPFPRFRTYRRFQRDYQLESVRSRRPCPVSPEWQRCL